MRNLPTGARVFVHVPDHGYVAVGQTLGEARRFDQAHVLVDEAWTPLHELELHASYRHVDDPAEETEDNAEYVVPVRWRHAVDLTQAHWQGGMFANQHSACRLTHQFTVNSVAQHFGLDPQ